MSVFRNRVKSKKQRHKKGHRRRTTNKEKRGLLMSWSWDDIKRKKNIGESILKTVFPFLYEMSQLKKK
ncbi:MAG: hypothetical protein KAW92_10480 [Candidatus Cloacimonetes bacterium]|nr:hypothetical protein [Candidatus Cloacimonadota bacterium]